MDHLREMFWLGTKRDRREISEPAEHQRGGGMRQQALPCRRAAGAQAAQGFLGQNRAGRFGVEPRRFRQRSVLHRVQIGQQRIRIGIAMRGFLRHHLRNDHAQSGRNFRVERARVFDVVHYMMHHDFAAGLACEQRFADDQMVKCCA